MSARRLVRRLKPMENSFPFVRPACVSLDSGRPSPHHQSTRTIRTSHVAASGRCAHHPGITPEGVICVIVITARWAAALGILSRARSIACAPGAKTLRSAVHVDNCLDRSFVGRERSGPADGGGGSSQGLGRRVGGGRRGGSRLVFG